MKTRRDLAAFVATLPIPPERREIVRMELEDHVFECIAELEASGVAAPEAERRSVESLGDESRLREELIDAQLAYSVSSRRAVFLGVRAGLFVGAVATIAAYLDGNPWWAYPTIVRHAAWFDPSPLFYVATALALLAAWPREVIRPFLAAGRHAYVARRAGNTAAARRLLEPTSNFFAGLITAASAPFFFWIAATAVGLPLGLTIEGTLLRTILASVVVNIVTSAVGAFLAFPPSRGLGREKGRLA